jgi:hypothetical protein
MTTNMLRQKLSLVVNSIEVSHCFSTNLKIDRRIRKEKQKSMFESAETNMVDGTVIEEGNFHLKEQQY